MTPEDRPPAPFRHVLDPQAPFPPLRPSPEIQELHKAWAGLHRQDRPAASVTGPLGQRALERARTAAAQLRVSTQHGPELARELVATRELIGALIRATDAVATRCDELSNRLGGLESALEEAVVTLSEELTAARAQLASTLKVSGNEPRA